MTHLSSPRSHYVKESPVYQELVLGESCPPTTCPGHAVQFSLDDGGFWWPLGVVFIFPVSPFV